MDWFEPQKFETKVVSLFYTPLEGEPISKDKLAVNQDGVRGDYHSEVYTLSTIREAKFVPRGSPVLNTRQVTISSEGESELVAKKMGIANVKPEDLMSNIHLEGIDFLSAMPPGTLIQFFDSNGQERQLVLFVTGINDPCYIPKERLEKRLEVEGAGFEKEAYLRRGLISMVYHPGFVKVGDTARITTPRIADQRQLG